MKRVVKTLRDNLLGREENSRSDVCIWLLLLPHHLQPFPHMKWWFCVILLIIMENNCSVINVKLSSDKKYLMETKEFQERYLSCLLMKKKKKFLVLKLRRGKKKHFKMHFPLSKICVNIFLMASAYWWVFLACCIPKWFFKWDVLSYSHISRPISGAAPRPFVMPIDNKFRCLGNR